MTQPCQPRRRFQSRRTVAAAALLLTCAAVAAPAAVTVDEVRQAAVLQARDGAVDPALATLERLFASHPDRADVRQDLAVVAGWAGRNARTTELLDGLDPATLPDYVLESYAKAARNLQRWDQALALYDALAARQPERLEPALARVLVLADADRFDAARTAWQRLHQALDRNSPQRADALYARGYLEERARHFTRALAYYHAALEHRPGYPEAQRRWILVTSALGAPQQALRAAAAHPGLLDEAEELRLRLDAAAMQVRRAPLPNPDAPRANARAALATQDALLAEPELAQPQDPRSRALHYDRVAALAADFRMAEATRAFEALGTAADELPVYVLAAAAQAYLYLQQAERAAPLYQHALDQEPNRFDLQLGLFYARSDLQDHDGARALTTRMLETQPAWLTPAPGLFRPNPLYPQAEEAAALELAFRNRYRAALDRFDNLLALAPANTDLRLSRAQVRRWRGWYAAAAEDVQRAQLLDPDSQRARRLAGHLALDSRRFAAAERAVTAALRDAPDAKATQDLAQRWALHTRPELIVDVGGGRSDGGAFSSRDWRAEGYYFSAPLAHRYRGFVHDVASYGRFDEGPGRDHRVGAGVEYRRPTWIMRGEVNQGLEHNDDAGAVLSADWLAGDHWSLSTVAALNSSNVPLRGTRIGLTGDELQVGGRYRWHEARSAALQAGVLDLDDGNRRQWLQLGFETRVLNRPRQQLLASARGYTSDNRDLDRVYYNPDADRELSVGLTHEWRALQHYDQRLTQRLGVELGDYWQQDFGNGSVWTLFIEHDWQLGPRTTWRYGARTGGRVYDGEREHMAAIYVGVTWRP